MQCFLYSVERSPDLLPCIDNLSSGNVRLALDFVKTCFGSGHVNTEKIIETYRYDDYVVPLHEFLRAIIYGDAVHYDPDRSPFANLFDISLPDKKEHFLLPCLLGYIDSPESHAAEEGFVAGRLVYETFQMAGFTPEQIDHALVRAHRKRLVETAARMAPAPGSAEPTSIRLTSIGAYHIGVLARQFTYIDAIVVDTPILEDVSYHSVVDVDDIRARLGRAAVFRSYLDKAWRLVPSVPGTFDWDRESTVLSKELTRIGERLAKKPSRPGHR
jgi:hypothetical protein